jgi:protocatechuate 3,4-dioxygenase beta subunit
MRSRIGAALAVLALLTTALTAQQQAQGRRQQQNRDQAQQPAGTAVIGGRVLAADTGRPVKHARVTVSGGGGGFGRQSRSTSTDEQGRYQIADLVGGSYTIMASRSGFVNAIYGQRRPLHPGTPVDLADGQQLSGIDIRITRGGVITGRIVDEDGEPIARGLVTVQRYQYVNGQRQLVAAGGDQSDDRGVYRVFGLPPGDYFVSGNASGLIDVLGRGMPGLAAVLGGGGPGAGSNPVGRGRGGFFGVTEDPEPTGYAPTYYPGVISSAEAAKVSVGPGQEVTGIDFQVQLVATATVSGLVTGADGPAAVMLIPTDAGGMIRAETLRGSAGWDGTFSIPNVPPGRYTAAAQSGARWEDPKIGTVPLTVSGQNITGLTIAMQDGVTLSGNITVESSGTPAPADYSGFRIDMPEVDPLPLVGGPGRGGGPNATGARAEKNGTFSIGNVFPGRHYVRVTTQGNWTLKSVQMGASDVTDQAVEVHAGQDVDNVTVVLTDRATDLSGTVRDGVGNPVSGATVIVFSADPQYWRAQSRRIQAVRTGATGAYRMHGLPPGDYQVVAVDDVENGEWYDPTYLDGIKDRARSISIDEGEKKALDVSAPSSSNP